jgi:hypothetical protein
MAKSVSEAEQDFQDAWDKFGLPKSDIKREHRFCKDRAWRFDFAFPSQKVAIEIQGIGRAAPAFCGRCKCVARCPRCSKAVIVSQAGGHQTPKGLRNDCQKHNRAVLDGWRILVFTTADYDPVGWVDAVKELLLFNALAAPAATKPRTA